MEGRLHNTFALTHLGKNKSVNSIRSSVLTGGNHWQDGVFKAEMLLHLEFMSHIPQVPNVQESEPVVTQVAGKHLYNA